MTTRVPSSNSGKHRAKGADTAPSQKLDVNAARVLEARLRGAVGQRFHLWCVTRLDGVIIGPTLGEASLRNGDCLGTAGDVIWRSPWFRRTPSCIESLKNAFAAASRGGSISVKHQLSLIDGQVREHVISFSPVHEADGRTIVATVVDLQRVVGCGIEDRDVQEAQELAWIDRLAIGVVHDFGNILQCIRSAVELAERQIDQERGQIARRFLQEAQHGIERANAISQRLLMSARPRLAREAVVDPRQVLADIKDLILHAAGSDVEVRFTLECQDCHILCDPDQLETTVLNLTRNARDSMPTGGTLTISVEGVTIHEDDFAFQEEIKAGHFVCIVVADTGCGMNDVIKARALEPFFSTKPVGRGTGLGLSQTHDFMRLSSGVVQIESAPKSGTNVRLRFPRYELA